MCSVMFYKSSSCEFASPTCLNIGSFSRQSIGQHVTVSHEDILEVLLQRIQQSFHYCILRVIVIARPQKSTPIKPTTVSLFTNPLITLLLLVIAG